MANLLEETLEAIKNSGHKSKDIIFIGSEDSGHKCTWNEYKKISNVNYDDGFGASEVATDLIIVFSDGSKMWRGEYDGSEWWEYSTPFVMPKEFKKISTLIKPMWNTLKEMNDN